MNATSTYRAILLSEAISPITHMSGAEGNEAVLMREPIQTADGTRWVPVLSGNAIRHRMFRGPGARYIVDRWKLAGKLTLEQLNFLFHGGTLSEGTGRIDSAGIGELFNLFPLFAAVGCSLPGSIVPGALYCWRGTLVCRENESAVRQSLPEGWMPEKPNLRSAAAFVEKYQYVRGNARVSAADLVADQSEEDTSQMIFAGQAVTSGALFIHGFTLRHASELALGALLLSLRLWQAGGGTIGGQAARGHGRLASSLHLDGVDQEQRVGAYIDHVEDVADAALEYLQAVFAKADDKPKRGGKSKAVADATT